MPFAAWNGSCNLGPMTTPYGNLTDKTTEALQLATTEAINRRHSSLEPAHVLVALLTQDGGVASSLFRRAGKDEQAIAAAAAGVLARLPKLAQSAGQPNLSADTHQLLLKAKEEAETMKDAFVSAEHVLLALAETPSLRAAFEPWVLEAAATPIAAPVEHAPAAPETDLLREEIRKVILEELKELTRQ